MRKYPGYREITLKSLSRPGMFGEHKVLFPKEIKNEFLNELEDVFMLAKLLNYEVILIEGYNYNSHCKEIYYQFKTSKQTPIHLVMTISQKARKVKTVFVRQTEGDTWSKSEPEKMGEISKTPDKFMERLFEIKHWL